MIDRFRTITILIFIALIFSQQSVETAYEPVEIEVIKVTNTLAADVNTAAVTQFNNINTTAVINTNTDVFTSVDSDGINCIAGTYMVDVILYRTHNGGVNEDRANVAIQVTVDGTPTSALGADGYIRSSIDGGPSGHEEASTSISDLVVLTSAGKIGFNHQGLATIVTNAAPAGQSILRIVRIE